jgi:hypothetical protein
MLDPINSSNRSHQEEGNSEFIDQNDPTFDYLRQGLNPWIRLVFSSTAEFAENSVNLGLKNQI